MPINPQTRILEYFEILDIDPTGSYDVIKKAYRNRAKMLHPDVNKSHYAHQQFCLLNEAFDFFTTANKNQIDILKTLPKDNPWFDQNNTQRQRTYKYVDTRYDQFLKTDFYRTSASIITLVNLLGVLLFLFGILAIFYLAISTEQYFILIVAGVMLFLTRMGWISIISSQVVALKDREIQDAIYHLGKKPKTYIALSILFNVFVFAHTFGNTFITVENLFKSYVVGFLSGYLLTRIFRCKGVKKNLIWMMFPTVISLFFVMNYTCATDLSSEVHRFKYKTYDSGGKKHFTNVIVLENNAYNSFFGIRFLLVDNQFGYGNYVKFDTAQGLFGIKVLKDYEVSFINPNSLPEKQ